MLVNARGRSRVVLTTLTAVTLLPGVVASQPLDPTAVADVSTPIRAVGSFLLVLLFGGSLLTFSEGFVDRSVDASMESPLRSIAYGALAQIGLVLVGTYAVGQLAGLGSGNPIVGLVAFWVLALAWLALAGFGFTVVGAGLTEAAGTRQLWSGLAIGAAIAAFVWMLPTVLLGALASVVVVSIGIGGPTKRWLHASMDGDAEVESDA